MKIKLVKKLKEAGTALLVAMVVGGILCVSITGYLSLAEHQNFLSMRSQCWNMAITVVEAGLEDGIEHLNLYPTNPGQDGWTFDGTWYSHSSTLPSGDSYTVYATTTNVDQPVILAKATVYSPRLLSKANFGFMFAAAGVNVSTGPVNVSRAVQIKTKRGILFTKAMVARNTIDLKGNNISTDSFDSGDPFHSNYGKYSSATAKDNGDIASNDTIINSISIANANIYGHIQTGPNGSFSIGNGGVGSHNWQDTLGNKGVEPNGTEGQNWSSHDANFTFPDTALPYGSGSSGVLSLGPAGDIPTTTINIVSNYNGSAPSYPNPPPWSGVSTNFSWITNSFYPGVIPGMVTNASASTVSYTCPNYPSAGTYAGAVVTNVAYQSDKNLPTNGCYYGQLPQGSHYNFYQILGYSVHPIASYAWRAASSYNYANYTTNSVTVTNHYDHVLNSGDYYVDSSPSGSTIVLGDARLVINSGLNMSGGDKITIANGARLLLYSGGTSAKIGGNGIANLAGYSYDFIMYCAPTVTTFAFQGNGEFIGVLVAPTADLTMGGGGSSSGDFEGALVANSIGMNGHFSFHYDEALGRMPANGRLLITQWDEVDPKRTP